MSGKPADQSRKVSRLPPLPQPLDPIIEELFADTRRRGGEPLNLHHTTGHAPKLSKARRVMTVALRNDCKHAAQAARAHHPAHVAYQRLPLRARPP